MEGKTTVDLGNGITEDRYDSANLAGYSPGFNFSGDRKVAGSLYPVLDQVTGEFVEIPIGKAGSGFNDEVDGGVLKAVLSTADPADTVEAADCDAIIRTGQWLDIDQSEADRINKRAMDGFNANKRTLKAALQNQKVGTTDAKGKVTGLIIAH